jgi:hypothetical protein
MRTRSFCDASLAVKAATKIPEVLRRAMVRVAEDRRARVRFDRDDQLCVLIPSMCSVALARAQVAVADEVSGVTRIEGQNPWR